MSAISWYCFVRAGDMILESLECIYVLPQNSDLTRFKMLTLTTKPVAKALIFIHPNMLVGLLVR